MTTRRIIIIDDYRSVRDFVIAIFFVCFDDEMWAGPKVGKMGVVLLKNSIRSRRWTKI